MKKYFLILPVMSIIFLLSCSSSQNEETKNDQKSEEKSMVGFVDLNDPVEEDLVKQGMTIFMTKCAKCHTIDTTEFGVPAFAGITNRRSPEWIMNMILNVDDMLATDSTAKALLKRHRKIMPDPELTVEQARAMLEFFRKNDMVHVGEKDLGAKE